MSEDDLRVVLFPRSMLIQGLFSNIGPLQNLRLKYDKAGRSDGIAFITYLSIKDAEAAIAKFNGANAAGQPITVTLDSEGPPSSRRDSRPSQRDRVFARNAPRGGGGGGGGGRMAGVRSGRGGPRGAVGGERRERRPARTQEELDKELDDFMNAPPPAAAEANGTEETGEEMAVD